MKKIILTLTFFAFFNMYSQITTTYIVESNISCYNGVDGAFKIIANGGSGNYIYLLYPLNIMNSTGLFTNLGRGYYQCRVSEIDNNNQFTNQDVFFLDPSQIYASANVVNNNISINASGGVPPYQYSIDGSTFQTSNNFSNLALANYVVIVKDSHGCFIEVTVNISSLDSEKFDFQNFKLYPNPTSGIIRFSNVTNIKNIFVYDVLGEKVFSKNINSSSSQIDLSNIPNGIYFIKLQSENQERVIKIIKTK